MSATVTASSFETTTDDVSPGKETSKVAMMPLLVARNRRVVDTEEATSSSKSTLTDSSETPETFAKALMKTASFLTACVAFMPEKATLTEMTAETVGIIVGTGVGYADGVSVVGRKLGSRVGLGEGCAVGTSLGDTVGIAVGEARGVAVVGGTVGRTDGAGVGLIDGVCVGTRMGASEGA